jgi:hypothetical protein
MLGLVYRIGAAILICGGSEANAGDKEQVDQQDGNEYEGSDDDVEGAEAEDALFGVLREIGRGDVVFVVMVAVIGFGHRYQAMPEFIVVGRKVCDGVRLGRRTSVLVDAQPDAAGLQERQLEVMSLTAL